MHTPVVHSDIWNDRTLRFQTIHLANTMVTWVWLRSFQSSTIVRVVSQVSNHSVSHKIVSFCNRSDILRKRTAHTHRRTVKSFHWNGTKTEWNVNIIPSHSVWHMWQYDINVSFCSIVFALNNYMDRLWSVWSVLSWFHFSASLIDKLQLHCT